MSTAILGGRTALITGGAQGIGKGIARALARAGAAVCINDTIDEADGQRVADEIRHDGAQCIFLRSDISNRVAVEHMVKTCVAQLGGISILVSNASTSVRASLLETRFDDLQRAVEVNVYGAFHVCQLVAAHMIDAGIKGSIIQISSPHATLPYRRAIDYRITKSAVHNFALSIAGELIWHGIRVNVVEPGWTVTPGERTWHTEQALEEGAHEAPLGRLGLPSDIGNAVVFLASEYAEYIAGAVLRVDGGQFLQGWTQRR